MIQLKKDEGNIKYHFLSSFPDHAFNTWVIIYPSIKY